MAERSLVGGGRAGSARPKKWNSIFRTDMATYIGYVQDRGGVCRKKRAGQGDG